MLLHYMLLHAPPRQIQHSWGHLKKRMVFAPGACPMAVLCTSVHNSGEFKAKHKNVYPRRSKNQLATEHPDNPYYTVALADVYVGLSDEFALHSRVTHRDLVNIVIVTYVACIGWKPQPSRKFLCIID